MNRNKMFLPNRGIGPIVFLAVVLAVMLAALLFSTVFEGKEKVVPLEDRSAPATFSIDSTPFDPRLAEWGVIDDRTEVGLQSTPVEAFKAAAAIVAARPWGRIRDAGNVLRENQYGFATLDAPDLIANPGAWRGVPVEMVGRLIDLNDYDLFDAFDMKLPDGRYKVKQGLMRLRESTHGRSILVRFTLLDEVAPDAPLLVPGQEVKLQGVFFKLQTLKAEQGDELGCWILGKRLLPTFLLPDENSIDLDSLALVRDAELAADASRSLFDEPPFFHLLARVFYGFPVNKTEVVPMKGKETRALLERPKDFRGKVIELQGRVMKFQHFSLSSWFPELNRADGPISEFWITYVTSDGYVPLAILWLNEPDLELKVDNQVRVKAVSYRVWGYFSKDNKPTKAPLLIGLGTIEPLAIGADHGVDSVAVGIALFVVLALTLVFFVLRHDLRRRALFEDTRRARKKLVRGPLGGEATGPAADGDSDPS